MRKIFTAFLIIAALCLLPVVSNAQIPVFGSGTMVTGVSNLVAGTNTFVSLPVKQIQAFNLTFLTNNSSPITNNILLTLDKTNFVVCGTFTYSGTGPFGPTNFPPYNTNIPVYLFMQMQAGTNVTYVQLLYGP